MQATEIQHTPNPACGSKACIAGPRLRVMDLVTWREMRGSRVEELDSPG